MLECEIINTKETGTKREDCEPERTNKEKENPGTENDATESKEKQWDWRDNYMMLGTDVVSLLPSLTRITVLKALENRWNNQT